MTALAQVLFIDLVLAGDNAVVVGMAVAGLPAQQKRRAILGGIAGAALIRIGLALVALELLAIIGLMLAGGVLLLWVCWRMYRELRAQAHEGGTKIVPHKTLARAVWQIILADLSMSLDNVLAVAGAARSQLWIMAAGLALSVLLMGIAAELLARILERHRWIAWLGLATVVYVAITMVIAGSHEVSGHLPPGLLERLRHSVEAL